MNKKTLVKYLLNKNEDKIFREASFICEAHCGKKVFVRGIIEFSNICVRNCLYCGLRRDNHWLTRYRMKPTEIVQTAKKIIEQGIKTVVLQSADDLGFKAQALAEVIKRIKKIDSSVAVTLSIGERPLEDYRILKDSGADRYLLKHETANAKLYNRLHPGQTLRKRLKIIEFLKKLGYEVGSGNIVGLPGQTIEDLAEDILLMKKLAVKMAAIGPFVPQQQTPFADYPAGNPDLVYRVIALTRLMLPDVNIPATTALATVAHTKGVLQAFSSGANVLMCNLTPLQYRQKYRIYDNKSSITLREAKRIIRLANKEME